MGQEQAESLERSSAGGGLELPGVEAGELGPAEPESSPEADAGQPWPGDSAAPRLMEPGSESLGAGFGGEILEPGEAGPAEPATDALPGPLGQFPEDLGQAAGAVERGFGGDLGQVAGDAAGLAKTAATGTRVAAGDASAATQAAGMAASDLAGRAGEAAESVLPGGDATPQAPEQAPRAQPR
jgi:hypothetical protein